MVKAKTTAPPRPRNTEPIYAHIVGWGVGLPERTMTNDDLTAFVDTSDESVSYTHLTLPTNREV